MTEDNISTTVTNFQLPSSDDALKTLQVEKERLLQQLVESRQHTEQLEKGIAYFRSKAEERHLEQKDGLHTIDSLQKQIKISFKEKEEAVATLKKAVGELQKEKTLRHEVEAELEAVQSQFDSLKASLKLAKEQHEESVSSQKGAEQTIAMLQKVEILMQNAFDFRAKLEQKIAQLEKINEEKELHVRQAQQHLAKK